MSLKTKDPISYYSKYAPVLLEICFFIHLVSSLVGWNHTIDDHHGFRQSQTAITVYYTLRDGFHLNYEIPVMGKPWALPMEFPLFQWLVAAAVLAFHTPLDQTGRFFSLLFFYLSLVPFYFLLGSFLKDRNDRFLILCFVLMCPTYLFWSRTFLMESLALFLSLSYLWAAAKLFETKKASYLAAAFALGSLAGLVKITTFIIYGLAAFLIGAWRWNQKDRPRVTAKETLSAAYHSLFLFGLPLLITRSWVKFTDDQKILNPLGWNYSSFNSSWIFGTAAQRLSPGTWQGIWNNSHIINLFGQVHVGWFSLPLFFLAAAVSLALIPERRTLRAICLAVFLFPLLLFVNLYYQHDYYFFACNILLCLFCALTFRALLDHAKSPLRSGFLLASLLAMFTVFYMDYRASYPLFTRSFTLPLASMIRDLTDEKDVLLIYGFDWDPTVPYYSGRRALMEKWELPLDDPKMRKILGNLGDDPIRAMLIAGPRSRSFIQERVSYFGLNPRPYVLFGHYALYVAKGKPTPRH